MVMPTTLRLLCLGALLSTAACHHVNSSEACLRELRRVKPLARVRMLQQVPPGFFTGIVLDSATKRPLPSTEVQFRDLRLGVLTDSLGSFRVVRVPPGTHAIVVQKIGYQRLFDTV